MVGDLVAKVVVLCPAELGGLCAEKTTYFEVVLLSSVSVETGVEAPETPCGETPAT
jgi:hypothetical protein